MKTQTTIRRIYELLEAAFGPQHWWPADSAFEMMVGAVLTQNTSWKNVEKAIANLKSRGLLSPPHLRATPPDELASLLRPAGYFRVKAKRLVNLVEWLLREYAGDVVRMSRAPLADLREGLLSVKGVGPETADSILLYAARKPTFVVDTYTYRVLLRHGLVDESAGYEEIRELFESNLPADVTLFGEFHALLVAVGKKFCRKIPRCGECPLRGLLEHDAGQSAHGLRHSGSS